MSKLFTLEELTKMASTFDSILYKPPSKEELNKIVRKFNAYKNYNLLFWLNFF